MSQVWFITGAGRGFGLAFAREVVRRGGKVIAGMRHLPLDNDFFTDEHVLPVKMDVTKPEEIRQAVELGIKKFGSIDVLVNNAGFGLSGAFEETTDADLRNLFETDYFGVVNVTRAVLPYMRSHHKGLILNVSSQGGLMGFAGSSAYCAAKFAVVGLTEVLRLELAPFGIEAASVCPGSFRTDFRKGSSMHKPSARLADYDGTSARAAGNFLQANQDNQKGDPHKAAVFLCDMVAGGNLPSRILIGPQCCSDVKALLEKQLQDIQTYEDAAGRTDFED
jgi:NAD(P)-dependent dehydrogenase (short-subunit alcohol dehydrogenase family)